MSTYVVPFARPKPDAGRLMRCVLGSERLNKPPVIDYLVDRPVMRLVVTQMLGREWVEPVPGDRRTQTAYWDNVIEFWYRMGYDYVMMELPLPFPKHDLVAQDTTAQSDTVRVWTDEHRGAIASWDDFERYAWPRVEDFDFFPFEYVSSHVREGMGLMAAHSGGLFEYLRWILSLEGLAFLMHDVPELVEAVIVRLAALMDQFHAHLLDLENLIALWPGDDMGFRTATLVSPDFLRRHILPWYKQSVSVAHDRGIPVLLHSCGNLEAIMADLIDEVGIDGKHSFEDVIMPAAEFQQRYGDRVATLGGVDMHVLASAEPEVLRGYVRRLIEQCAPKGRFAVGAGNSVANYVPLENYFVMLDEALR